MSGEGEGKGSTATEEKPHRSQGYQGCREESQGSQGKRKAHAAPAQQVPLVAPAPPVAPVAQADVIPREDEGSSNEAASTVRGEWDAVEICRVLCKMANAPHEVAPTDNIPEEIQLEVNEYMMKWDE